MEFKKTSVVSTPEILKRKLGGELFVPVTIDEDAFADGVVKAGTPISADGEIATVSGGTKGTWSCAISTAFAEDEEVVINGETYTCGSTESKADKVFAGANASAQATSLVAVVEDANFVLTSSTSTLTFTQKVPDASGNAPTVTTDATTGAVGTVTAGTSPVDGTNNAIGILLNDVYEENPNGSLIKAYAVINSSVASDWSGVAYDGGLKSALSNIVFE